MRTIRPASESAAYSIPSGPNLSVRTEGRSEANTSIAKPSGTWTSLATAESPEAIAHADARTADRVGAPRRTARAFGLIGAPSAVGAAIIERGELPPQAVLHAMSAGCSPRLDRCP